MKKFVDFGIGIGDGDRFAADGWRLCCIRDATTDKKNV